jgi:hypothetical protein
VLFVDSGAFPAFMAGGGLVDFDTVLRRYEELARVSAIKSNLFIVAPDKIGDQEETERLLTLYAPNLRRLSGLGVSILVPVQAGATDLLTTWERLTAILDGVRIIPAMPMRAAAISVGIVVNFLRRAKVSQVHLLGTSRRSTVDTIGLFLPELQVTADANQVRAAVGEGRPVTDGYRSTVSDLCHAGWCFGGSEQEDGTEFSFDALNTPGFLAPSEVALIADWLTPWQNRTEVLAALANGSLNELVGDELSTALCDYVIPRIHRARVAREVGPSVRSATLAEHFSKRRADVSLSELFAA